MEKNYKILVLSDLKSETENVLKNTINFAKKLKADVDFLYIKNPTDVIKKESQLSAMRVINKEHLIIDKKIEALLKPIRNTHRLNIKSNFTIGNVKSEIEKYIKSSKPDIIVLGKRKPNTLKFTGDKIINYVLKQYKGTILIAGNENVLEPEKELSLGVFSRGKELVDTLLVKELEAQTVQPLKAFKIVDNKDGVIVNENSNNSKVEEFIFQKNNNTIESLSKSLLENNINVLCLNRDMNAKNKTSKALTPLVKQVINKLNVSILLTNENTLVV